MNISRFIIVVDNCDLNCEELVCLLLDYKDEDSDIQQHLRVVKGYYQKEYCIQVDTPERVKEVIDIIDFARSMGKDI